MKELSGIIKKNDEVNLFYFSLETLLYDCISCLIKELNKDSGYTQLEELNRANIGRIVRQVFDIEKEFNIRKKDDND